MNWTTALQEVIIAGYVEQLLEETLLFILTLGARPERYRASHVGQFPRRRPEQGHEKWQGVRMSAYEYGEQVYETDNRLAAGTDVVRLETAIYQRMIDNLFELQYGDTVRAKDARSNPDFRRFYDALENVARDRVGALARQNAKQLAKEVESSEGICNAWVTMWIWNAYQNVATITDPPRKLLCKKFQRYYQTTTVINIYKSRADAEIRADTKFMRLLGDYTREFGLKEDSTRSTSGEFPPMQKDIYQPRFSRLADSMRDAVTRNPGVGFKLIVQLQRNAHAIGLLTAGADAMYIFDPNFGLYRYKDSDLLRADLYCLFDGSPSVYAFKPNSRWSLRAITKLNSDQP